MQRVPSRRDPAPALNPGLNLESTTPRPDSPASDHELSLHTPTPPLPVPQSRASSPGTVGRDAHRELSARLPALVAARWVAASGLRGSNSVSMREMFEAVAARIFGKHAHRPMRLQPLREGFERAGLTAEWNTLCRDMDASTRQCLMAGHLSPCTLMRGYAERLASWRTLRTPLPAQAFHQRLRAEGRGDLFWRAVSWFDPPDVRRLGRGELSPAQFFTLYASAAQLRPDVLVVGAGAAGLAAASALRDQGLRVTVLETRNDIGGRARTQLHGFATRIDLGAARLHSGAVNPLTPVAQTFGFTLHDDAPGGLAFLPSGKGDPRDDWRGFEAERADITEWLAEAAVHSDDRTVGEVELDPVPGPWRESALASLIPLQTGHDVDVQSVEDYFRIMPESHGDVYVTEGIGELIHALGTGLDVHLDTHVECIEDLGKSMRVHTPQATYKAGHVVVTVALSELNKIRMAPPLPAWKTEAMQQVSMGHYEKVFLQFSRNIFGKLPPGTPLQVACKLEEPMDFTLMPPLKSTGEAPGHVVVVAYAGGRFAQKLARNKDAAISHALGLLREAFGADIDEAFVHGDETHWEQWIGGAYSSARPGGYRSRALLRTPVNNRLHFAGEACDRELCNGATWSTHLAGAYRSGLEAAGEVVKATAQEAPSPDAAPAGAPLGDAPSGDASVDTVPQEPLRWRGRGQPVGLPDLPSVA